MEIKTTSPSEYKFNSASSTSSKEEVKSETENEALKGEIHLPVSEYKTEHEMIKQQAISKTISQALVSSGFKPTAENLELAQLLFINQMPITKETLTKLNYTLKLFGSDNLDKALFFVANEIRPTGLNIEQLNKFITGENKISNQVGDLINALLSIEDENVREAITNAILKPLNTNSNEQQPKEQAIKQQLIQQQIKLAISNDNKEQVKQQPQFELIEAAKASNESVEHKQLNNKTVSNLAENIANNLIEKLPLKNLNELTSNFKNISLQNLENEVQKETIKEVIKDALKNKIVTFLKSDKLAIENLNNILKDNILEESLEKLISQHNNLDFKLNTGDKFTKLTDIIKYIIKNAIENSAENSTKNSKSSIENSIEQTIKNNISNPSEPEINQAELVKKLMFNPKETTSKQLNLFLNELKQIINNTKITIEKASSETALSKTVAENIQQAVKSIEQNMNFVSQLKTNLFLQIPLVINNHQTNAELFIFKDKKGKKKAKGDAVSALIALDTASLGRFEAFVQKDNKAVSCRFNLENDEVEVLVRQNIGVLSNALKQQGYILESFTFAKNEPPKTILEVNNFETNTLPNKNTALGMSFDTKT